MFTTQETFDKAVGGILAQGELGAGETWDCRYRLEKDGQTLKCAVGHLIPDQAYRPHFEGILLGHMRWAYDACDELRHACDDLLAAISDHDLAIAMELQGAHDDSPCIHPCDGARQLEEFKRRAREIADRHGLEWNFD